ncbi:MFS general substrate transporter [Mrakia frigida]|uniref:MCT family MFS transporter n=1 Tax=Mrakia frigida TaxID=29902 RepID=UPI003FCC0017
MEGIDSKKDDSPSSLDRNYEPELERSGISREVVDGPNSVLERELDEEEAVEDEKISFPDGGRGWFVVAGAVHMTFATFGFTNGWGVFQAYYEEDLLSKSSSSSIAWIGSLQYCLILLPAVVMGRLLDKGVFIVPYTVAALVYTASIVLTAQCKVYYQFVLCQGILQGLSAGVMYGPTLALISHWFHKKRALAYGVVACGSSIGGTIFPIMVRKLIPLVGFQWTIRACALIILYCVTFGWCTLRPRLKPKRSPGGLFNFAAFRRPPFALYVLGCFLVMLGIYTPITYLDVAATQIRLGEFSSYLIAIVNAFTLVGRLSTGFFADRVGPVNILIPFCVISGVLIFAWPFCLTKASLVVFSALLGISTGAFVSLFSPGVAQLGDTHDLGRRMGVLTTCLAIAGLIGPPISGAILSSTGSFLAVASFAGPVVLLGALVMAVARWALLGKWLGKM